MGDWKPSRSQRVMDWNKRETRQQVASEVAGAMQRFCERATVRDIRKVGECLCEELQGYVGATARGWPTEADRHWARVEGIVARVRSVG